MPRHTNEYAPTDTRKVFVNPQYLRVASEIFLFLAAMLKLVKSEAGPLLERRVDWCCLAGYPLFYRCVFSPLLRRLSQLLRKKGRKEGKLLFTTPRPVSFRASTFRPFIFSRRPE